MSRLPDGPSLLALVGDFSGPTLWRCLQPITGLEAAGYPCAWDRTRATLAPHLAAKFDGVMLSRVSWLPGSRPLVAETFRQARAAGRFLVIDVDDDLFSAEFTWRQLDVGTHDGRSWERLEADRYERIWALSVADGITVSTEPLAEIVRSFTSRPVLVLPNAIDLRWFRATLRRRPRQLPPVTVGWAGGARPDADLAPMAEGWRRIAQRFPSVRFVVQGYQPELIRQAVPEGRLHAVPWLPLERYPEPLVDVDIACCAVADDRFNRCKTPIKAWEAAVAGAAVVATPTLYGDDVRHAETGMLAETAEDWEWALAELIERPSWRRMLARRLLRRVERDHALDRNLAAWPAAWAAVRAAARGEHGREAVAGA